jgi:ABC-2 type transport system ATP-binding protein
MLEARSLSKRYGSTLALDSLNLTVAPGEVFCLLGPNGAGKTTTVNLFLDFISPSAGQALVCGIEAAREPQRARRALAYIPETVTLYPALSGVENLGYFSTLADGLQRPHDELLRLLQQAGLDAVRAQQPVAGYSKGMRQKVGIAVALARGAKALLLDEPTSGLDPRAANEFAAAIDTLRRQGVAVLMVTHDLFLARQCATRVGIMQRGRLVRVLDAATVDPAGLERIYLDASMALAEGALA